MEPSRYTGRSSDGARTRSTSRFAPCLVWLVGTLWSGLCVPAGPSAPDHPRPGLLRSGGVTLLHRYYEPMRRSQCLPPSLRAPHLWKASLPLAPSTAGHRDRPALVRSSVLECCAPYTGGSSSAFDQFFLDDIGLRPTTLGSALRECSHQRLQVGLPISARQAFLYVAALQLACPPGHSAPPCGARGRFTPELSVDSLPLRQSGMLPGRLVDCRGRTLTGKKSGRCRLHRSAGRCWPTAG